MNRFLGLLTVGVLILPVPRASADPQTSVTLYQIGQKGRYCLSLTKEEGGCISGMDGAGQAINLVDVTRGKKVRFENLSDAPHDMKITGENAENLPAQGVGAAPVNKQMDKEDRNKQSITCSFHGNQLGVGYRVLDDSGTGKQRASEHRDRRADLPAGSDPSEGEIEAGRPMVRTGLADVAGDVLTKGRPEDVEKLIASRPELIDDLKKIRPLLAEEISAKLESTAGGKDGKERVGKDGDELLAGDGEDGDGLFEKASLGVEGLAALSAGAGGIEAPGNVTSAAGKNPGSLADGITFDDAAIGAAGATSDRNIAGSDGRKIGGAFKSVMPPSKRLLASVDGNIASFPTGKPGARAGALLTAFTENKTGVARLLVLVTVLAIGFRAMFILLSSKRRSKRQA